MSKDYIKSPLNYIGGKYKLLPQLLPLFPNDINVFVDLFCGGANVGVNATANKIVLNDNLIFLIELYNSFLELTENEIITHIDKRIDGYSLSINNQDGYLKLRDEYNTHRNPLDLFVLLSFSFNHQIRFNNKHKFNCPFGKNRSCYNKQMKNNLIQFVNAIQNKNVKTSSLNFDDFDFSTLKPNDFVYADPPYLITTGSYNDGKRGFTGWNELTEKKLLETLKELDNNNIRFGLSNVLYHKGKTNQILTSWIENNDFYVNYLNKDYSNCNYHSLDKNKNSSIEVLVTNYVPTKNKITQQ